MPPVLFSIRSSFETIFLSLLRTSTVCFPSVDYFPRSYITCNRRSARVFNTPIKRSWNQFALCFLFLAISSYLPQTDLYKINNIPCNTGQIIAYTYFLPKLCKTATKIYSFERIISDTLLAKIKPNVAPRAVNAYERSPHAHLEPNYSISAQTGAKRRQRSLSRQIAKNRANYGPSELTNEQRENIFHLSRPSTNSR